MTLDAAGRGGFLDGAIAATQRLIGDRKVRLPDRALVRLADHQAPDAPGFVAALSRMDRFNVIAECKRRSPASGILRPDFDAVALARAYEEAGAAAISVITEPAFFGGSLDDLRAVRAATRLPVLRKDFIVDEYQVLEARAAGADAVLLILAALETRAFHALLGAAGDLGLAAVVEVRTARELGVALDGGAAIVGVNSRNLETLEVNAGVLFELAPRLPARVTSVAESGIRHVGDLRRLADAGYRAFLVGTRLVAAPDPGLALRELLEARVAV
jgi:indole-3-glycerol phosphate synthase